MIKKFRSDCPVASALDIIGDKWTLVIVRDMLFGGKSTFKELSESTEKIASNILSSRLKLLEYHKIITKSKVPGNDKAVVYRPTDKGTSLAPVIVELIAWSDKNIREFNPDMINRDSELITAIQTDKKQFTEYIQKRY